MGRRFGHPALLGGAFGALTGMLGAGMLWSSGAAADTNLLAYGAVAVPALALGGGLGAQGLVAFTLRLAKEVK